MLGPGIICSGRMLSTAEEWSWFVGALGDDGDDGAGETVSLGELAIEKNFGVGLVNNRGV